MRPGNTVRSHRLARNESLRQTADAVGMDAGNLSKLERSLRGCSDSDKLALARHFGVSVSALFFADDVVNETTDYAGATR